MTDYRTLSNWDKARVDKEVKNNIEPKHHTNKHNGFEWNKPESTLQNIHAGYMCAVCWMDSHNCLCNHDS